MQKSKMAILGIIATIALIPSMGLAFATTEDELDTGIVLGDTVLTNAESGTLAGLFLSTIAVFSKFIKNEAGKQPDPRKYAINVAIGLVSAVLVGQIPGISAIVGHEAIPFGTAFALLFFIDQIVKPMYAQWQIARKAKPTP